MSIFNFNNDYEMEAPVFEGYTDENYGDIRALEESYEDYIAVIESIYKMDVAEINYIKKLNAVNENFELADEEKESIINDIEDEYNEVTEAAAKNVFTRIIDFLKNLWGKIKSFLEDVIRTFLSMFKSGKDFAEKYEKELLKKNLKGFKYDMHLYSNLDDSSIGDNIFKLADDTISREFSDITEDDEKLNKLIEDMKKTRDKVVSDIRGKYVGRGPLEASEFNSALYSYFRSGALNTKDLEEVNVNIKKIISVLKDDSMVKNVKKALNSCNKSFDRKIKEINRTEKTFKNLDKDDNRKKTASLVIAALNKEISIFNETRSIALTFFRAWRNALHERERVYKSVCLAALRYKA